MNTDDLLAKRIVALREQNRWTQAELSKKVGLDNTKLSKIENGTRRISADELDKFAKVFDVSTDYLLGRKEKPHYYDLTEKDERDISKDLEKMIADLSDGGALAFSKDTTEIDEETRELLIASLENSLRIAKIEAKKKFTPKKYRD